MTPIDICFSLLIFVFAVIALAKGFVKELFGKISVILGLASSIAFSPLLTPYVENAVKNKIAAVVISFLLVFIVTFLVISIIQKIVEKIFSGEIMKGLDRILGFALGAVEGFVIVLFVMVVFQIQQQIKIIPGLDLKSVIDNSVFFNAFSKVVEYGSRFVRGVQNV